MASPEILDIPALLAPIPGDDPAGSTPFLAIDKLETLRKEILSQAMTAPDEAPKEIRPEDWRPIELEAIKTLTNESKHLVVAARLTEAVTRRHGTEGLQAGLQLLRELCESCWDRLLPTIEDGDVEGRVQPFYWLDAVDQGAFFPGSIRLLPLVFSSEGNYGQFDWKEAQTGKYRVTSEQFNKAMRATKPEQLQAVAAQLTGSLEELDKLTGVLREKMGQEASPGLGGIRQAVNDCNMLAQQMLATVAPTASAEGQATAGLGAEAGPAARAGGASPGSRAEVYRQLARAADVLRQLEPHSPIPYLIQRAVELGNKPFPELIKALIRDANVLHELNREFGIKEETPAEG
jgi:type VI secretion system protein ImpA